jgi:hypothetical protein
MFSDILLKVKAKSKKEREREREKHIPNSSPTHPQGILIVVILIIHHGLWSE